MYQAQSGKLPLLEKQPRLHIKKKTLVYQAAKLCVRFETINYFSHYDYCCG
jgi:hypothetical protein